MGRNERPVGEAAVQWDQTEWLILERQVEGRLT